MGKKSDKAMARTAQKYQNVGAQSLKMAKMAEDSMQDHSSMWQTVPVEDTYLLMEIDKQKSVISSLKSKLDSHMRFQEQLTNNITGLKEELRVSKNVKQSLVMNLKLLIS